MIFTSYIGPEELEVAVTYSFPPGRKAKINAPMEDCYPEEEADVEIESVMVFGKDIYSTLSQEEKEEIEEKAMNHAVESAIDYAEQKADWERSQREEY